MSRRPRQLPLFGELEDRDDDEAEWIRRLELRREIEDWLEQRVAVLRAVALVLEAEGIFSPLLCTDESVRRARGLVD